MSPLFVSKLFHAFVVFLRLHDYLFFAQLDPVKDIGAFGVTLEMARESSKPVYETQRGRRRLNLGYLLPFLEASFLIVDTTIIFSEAHFKYSLTEMPQLFTHLIFPPEFYPAGDPMILLAIVMSFALAGCLLFDPMLEPKYHMYLQVDKKTGSAKIWQEGKVFPSTVSAKIYSYRRRAVLFNRCFMFSAFLVAEAFFLYSFSSYWTGTPRDYLMILLILTQFLYGAYCNLVTVNFYHMTVMYLRYKQDYLNEQVIKLTIQIKEKIGKNLHGKGAIKSERHRSFYRSFQALNRQILALYGEIKGHNRFWSKYLTLYILHYILEICVMTYGALFIDSRFGIQRAFFIFFSVEFVGFLCAISYASSMVVYRNVGLHKSCLTFCRQVQKMVPFGTRDLLKFDGMASNLRFIPSIAFTLLNQYKVNSKLFEMVVSYISITFMYMVTMLRQ